jgi:hypothetical protein
MLALGSGEPRWAQAFRDSLLTEAGQGLFAGPANSIKSAQYEAALRAYYYPRVRTAFPGLFTVVEEERLRQWFASINRRAQTVESQSAGLANAFPQYRRCLDLPA